MAVPPPPNIPLPQQPLDTPQGWRIWWRFFRNLATNIEYIIRSGGDLAESQVGEFEGEIVELQNRVRSLEARFQVFAIDALTKPLAQNDRFDELEQKIAFLAAPVNPGVFGNLTITANAGLAFQGQTNDSGSATATFTNAKNAGNPIFYLGIGVNGVAGVIPVLQA